MGATAVSVANQKQVAPEQGSPGILKIIIMTSKITIIY